MRNDADSAAAAATGIISSITACSAPGDDRSPDTEVMSDRLLLLQSNTTKDNLLR